MFLSLVGLVSAHTGTDDYSHHCGMGSMMYGSYGTTGMIFGWLIGLAVLVALVLLIVWLIKQVKK